jgi:putative transposase
VAFIDGHKRRRTDGLLWGVEPICEVLQFAPSTYYAAKSRPECRRRVEDRVLKAHISRIYRKNFRVYGAEKIWRALQREGIACGRDRVARLMAEMGIVGVRRQKKIRTTRPAKDAEARALDLVQRHFFASEPNRLWVADLTYCSTWAGFAYVAFIIDVYSRMIVGWRLATTLRTELALDALEMAIFSRRGADLSHLVHHSDRGVQYRDVRYTERLGAEEAVASVGSKGDSFDNALAETINGLYKAELVWHQGPWRTIEALELATAAWVRWWNDERLHGALGFVPPAEYETRSVTGKPEAA